MTPTALTEMTELPLVAAKSARVVASNVPVILSRLGVSGSSYVAQRVRDVRGAVGLRIP